MFEKFTERARKVMSLGRQEAQRLNSDFIGTEHILLGIIAEDGGVAIKVLKRLGAAPEHLKAELERLVERSPTPTATLGQLPFSPRSKRVIELAGEAASQLGHEVIGTEHLLLGIMKENEGIGAQVLTNFHLNLETVKDAVLLVLGQDKESQENSVKKEILITGTIVECRSEVFTVLQRDGTKKEILLSQMGVQEHELAVGRRVQIKIHTGIKFLD